MAFITPSVLPFRSVNSLRSPLCPHPQPLMTSTPPSNPQQPPPPKNLSVSNSSSEPGRKLTRNKPDSTTPEPKLYADGSAGDMVGGPTVGSGMGPRRGTKDKKVTRAAAIQKSQSFADAWAEQNQGKVDVWLIIGALTILTPLVILAWAIATGVIPTAGLFDE